MWVSRADDIANSSETNCKSVLLNGHVGCTVYLWIFSYVIVLLTDIMEIMTFNRFITVYGEAISTYAYKYW